MAGKSAVLTIHITGDSKDAQVALAQIEVSVKQADATTKKAGKSMGGAYAAIGAAMLGCVAASGQLAAATNGLNVIFGEQAGQMLTWAEGMASMGLSTAQAAGAATILGAQLMNAGATTEQMTIITQGLIETASALAIVLGGSATEAVMAMGAALRGEFDSLERYGITLTADAVATEAARLASEGYTFASEQQAKMVATLSLIQEQSTAILENAEDGTMNMAIATDHLKASTKNLAAMIGDVLTPANGVLIDSTATLIDGLIEQAEESELLGAVTDTLTQILYDLKDILDPLLTQALELLNEWMNRLADIIERYVQPVLDLLADVLDKVADALSIVIGFVEDAVEWFNDFTDSVHEAIDALTFWNDTYDPSVQSEMDSVPSSSSLRAGGHAATVVNINVTGATDPYALSRLLTRQLEQYANIQGRRPGEALAGAW